MGRILLERDNLAGHAYQIRTGNLHLDLAAHSARIEGNAGGALLNLTPTEFKLLFQLARSEAQILSREQLLDSLTGGRVHVTARTIDALWVEHLTELDDMRRGIGLRGYSQQDPLNEFRKEAFGLYEEDRPIDQKGLTVDATYTFSKAMDDSSNGGITNEPYNYNSYYARSNYQIYPYSMALNYSVSDYNITHSFVLDLVYNMPFHFKNAIENHALGGWTVTGKSFYRETNYPRSDGRPSAPKCQLSI